MARGQADRGMGRDGQKSGRKSGVRSGIMSGDKSGSDWARMVGGAAVFAPTERSQKLAFAHFAQRCSERFGLEWRAAFSLWGDLIEAFRREDWGALRPIVRLSRQGRRVFLARLSDGRFIFVLFDCSAGMPVTVFVEGMEFRPQGRNTIRLEVPHDLRR